MPRWLHWCYEILMACMAVAVLGLIGRPSVGWVLRVDLAIWAVFTLDYLVRLSRAPDRPRFFRGALVDLVAILPFDFAILAIDHLVAGHPEMMAKFPPESFEFLRAFRLVRTFRVLRLLRVFRAFALLMRAFDHARGVLRTRGLRHVLLLVLFFVIGMGVAVTFFEEKIATWYDGVWWSFVTAATVGYGDLAPASWEGRVIAVILMIVGIGTLGTLTGSIATYFLGQGRTSRNPHVRHVQSQLEAWDDLPAEHRRELARVLAVLAEGAP